MKTFWMIIALLAATTAVLFSVEPGNSSQQASVEPASLPASDRPSTRPARTASTDALEESRETETASSDPSPSEEPVLVAADDAVETADSFIDDERATAVNENGSTADLFQSAMNDSSEAQAPETQQSSADEAAAESANELAGSPAFTMTPAEGIEEVTIEDLLGLLSTPATNEQATYDEIVESPHANHQAAAPATATEAAQSIPAAPAKEFVLKGEGTQESPYVLDWDLLTSARTTFDPRQGKNEIPESISNLDGTWISLSGYTLFPMANPQPREVLLMLNAWDGCCLGVPPSPYDAIEVSLATAVGEERFAQEGKIVGKLTVDPYLVGDWLIGLYTISGATFTPSGS